LTLRSIPLVAFVLATLWLACLLVIFDPVWETNDDVAMAMVAHGYGFASTGSPNLLFSNVLWGNIVLSLQGVGGLQGYSVGTLGTLWVVAFAILFCLTRLGAGLLLAASVTVLATAWPILFPQFTVNAGLLAATSVLALRTYIRTSDPIALAGCCALAVLGFLVRPLEAALIAVVALPLLPWQLLGKDRRLQLAAACTALAVVLAMAADYLAYQTAEWAVFTAQNVARAPYTDFDSAQIIKSHPAVMAANGYSANDIDLISRWFFIDPQLFNPAKLTAMRSQAGANLGPISIWSGSVSRVLNAFGVFASIRMWPLAAVAAVFLILFPRRRLLAAWALFAVAVFGLGYFGASVHERVLLPVLVLLMIMPAAMSPAAGRLSLRLGVAAVVMSIAIQFTTLASKAAASTDTIENEQAKLAPFHEDLVFVWGGSLAFEQTYPVKIAPSYQSSSPRLFALGVMTLAPFSVAAEELRSGDPFFGRLRSENGLVIFASDSEIALLRTYCEEHFQEHLTATSAGNEYDQPRRLRCAKR